MTPADRQLRKFAYESVLEKRILLIMLLDPDVQDIWEQPTVLPYRNDRGVVRHHTFDFLVLTKSGEKLAIAVKPLEAAKRGRFDLELKQIARHMPPRFANRIVAITDQSFTWVEARNAEHLHHFRWRIDLEADDRTERAAEELRTSASIQDIVDRIGLGGRGYGAVMRQIAERRLRLVEHCLIDEDAIVVRGDA